MIKQRSFALLEVVIAISICMLCFSLLVQGTSKHLKKQMLLLKQIDAERHLELSQFDILQAWIQQGHFENPELEIAQDADRIIKLSKTYSKTSTHNEQWKKLTFTISYPKWKTSSKYNVLVKRVDKKFK